LHRWISPQAVHEFLPPAVPLLDGSASGEMATRAVSTLRMSSLDQGRERSSVRPISLPKLIKQMPTDLDTTNPLSGGEQIRMLRERERSVSSMALLWARSAGIIRRSIRSKSRWLTQQKNAPIHIHFLARGKRPGQN